MQERFFEFASRPEIGKARFPGEKRSRDASLRMTPGEVDRDFGAGFSANICDVNRVININKYLFTYRFIRMTILSLKFGIIRIGRKSFASMILT